MRAHHTVARGKKTTSFTERNLRPQCACRQCTAVNVGSGGKERRRASVGCATFLATLRPQIFFLVNKFLSVAEKFFICYGGVRA